MKVILLMTSVETIMLATLKHYLTALIRIEADRVLSHYIKAE